MYIRFNGWWNIVNHIFCFIRLLFWTKTRHVWIKYCNPTIHKYLNNSKENEPWIKFKKTWVTKIPLNWEEKTNNGKGQANYFEFKMKTIRKIYATKLYTEIRNYVIHKLYLYWIANMNSMITILVVMCYLSQFIAFTNSDICRRWDFLFYPFLNNVSIEKKN